MSFSRLPLRIAFAVFMLSCSSTRDGSGTLGASDGGTDAHASGVDSGANNAIDSGFADFAGTYSATYAGTYTVTSPAGIPGGSNTDSATITITDVAGGDLDITFQIPPNPPSGAIDFELTGNSGMARGPATGGMCFTGAVNGGTQTNCCTNCTITFSGDTFSQPNAGTFTGTTSEGVAYSGTYSGVWTGTKE